MRLRILAFAISLAGCSTAHEAPPPQSRTQASVKEGNELLGTQAHDWNVEHWIHSPPLTLASLRGRVVLVRWFMSTDCPFCSATAPSLRALDADFRAKGLSVIGFYHHKDPEPLDPANVESYVKRYGYTFPVAIDVDWKTLHDWWLDGHSREWTSVSFLIDKHGVIRFVHPGGKYEPGSSDEKELRSKISELLAQ